MTIAKPINENYAVTVVRVYGTDKLDGLDNLRAFRALGMQALVPKDYELGSLAILIPTEAQVSHEFAHANNLYRHSENNADPEQTGYLEDNRRVKAIRLRGHRSNALVLPLTALDYLGIDTSTLTEGATFDHIDGHEVVRKYVIREPITRADRIAKKHERAWRRVDEKMLPEHIDTDNWWRNEHAVPADARLIVSQKVHGTSIRIGHVPVLRRLNWLERLLLKIGVAELA